jgi:hypothetical protein
VCVGRMERAAPLTGRRTRPKVEAIRFGVTGLTEQAALNERQDAEQERITGALECSELGSTGNERAGNVGERLGHSDSAVYICVGAGTIARMMANKLRLRT